MTKFSAWHFGVRLKLSLLVGVHQCICLVRFMIQALEDPKLQSTLPESAWYDDSYESNETRKIAKKNCCVARLVDLARLTNQKHCSARFRPMSDLSEKNRQIGLRTSLELSVSFLIWWSHDQRATSIFKIWAIWAAHVYKHLSRVEATLRPEGSLRTDFLISALKQLIFCVSIYWVVVSFLYIV